MKLFKGITALSLSLASFSCLTASTVSEELARTVAINCLSKYENVDKQIDNVKAKYYQDVLAQYIINFKNGGWVIVSADNAVNPIVGYSPSGEYIIDEKLSNNDYFLTLFGQSVKHSKTSLNGLKSTSVSSVDRKWSELVNYKKSGLRSAIAKPNRVDNILVDKVGHEIVWNQTDAYSMSDYLLNPSAPSCADKTYWHFPPGCVPVAVGMIMKKWEWPSHINATHYNSSTKTTEILDHCIDWQDIPYEETRMTNNSTAELLAFIGRILDTKTSDTGSSTYASNVAIMIDKFGYTSSSLLYKDNYTPEQWGDILRTEVLAGRPVYYDGGPTTASEPRHSFVLSGYNGDDFFWFNFAMKGATNGFYSIETGDDMNMKYMKNQMAIIGISPVYPSENVCPDYSIVDDERGVCSKENVNLPCSSNKFIVYSDGILTVEAGKHITFNKGFSAEPGARIRARTKSKFLEDHRIKFSFKEVNNSSNGYVDITVKNANSYYIVTTKGIQLVQLFSGNITEEEQTIRILKAGELLDYEQFGIILLNNDGRRFSSMFKRGQTEPLNYYYIPLQFNQLDYQLNPDGYLAEAENLSNYDKGMALYPNPAKDKCTLSVGKKSCNISIVDMGGRILKTINGVQGDVELDLTNFAKGVYHITAISDDAINVKKIIVK